MDELESDRRPAWFALRLASPVVPKAIQVPSDDRLRLDDVDGIPPVFQGTHHEDPEHVITVVDPWAAHAPSQDG